MLRLWCRNVSRITRLARRRAVLRLRRRDVSRVARRALDRRRLDGSLLLFFCGGSGALLFAGGDDRKITGQRVFYRVTIATG